MKHLKASPGAETGQNKALHHFQFNCYTCLLLLSFPSREKYSTKRKHSLCSLRYKRKEVTGIKMFVCENDFRIKNEFRQILCHYAIHTQHMFPSLVSILSHGLWHGQEKIICTQLVFHLLTVFVYLWVVHDLFHHVYTSYNACVLFHLLSIKPRGSTPCVCVCVYLHASLQ